MKPVSRILAVAAFAALATSVSAGPKIGLLLKGRSDFWTAMQKGAEAAAAKAGAQLLVRAPNSESDIEIQIALLHALANEDIQALVIAPTNAESLAGPVAAVAARGIKVVVIDSPLDGPAARVFVGTNQRAAGAAAGDLLAGLVGDTDEVAIFRHSQTGGATLLRESAASAALRARHPDLVIYADVYASGMTGQEVTRARYLLAEHPGVKAIFASGTPGTMAMLQVLSARTGPDPIKFVGCGFNLNPTVVAALRKGTLSGWIAQLPGDTGAKGIETALALLAGQSVPPTVDTAFVVVTKDNLDDPSVQALLTL